MPGRMPPCPNTVNTSPCGGARCRNDCHSRRPEAGRAIRRPIVLTVEADLLPSVVMIPSDATGAQLLDSLRIDSDALAIGPDGGLLIDGVDAAQLLQQQGSP